MDSPQHSLPAYCYHEGRELPSFEDLEEPKKKLMAHRVRVDHCASLAPEEALIRQAFEIGWDFARYGCWPEFGTTHLWDGYRAGVDHFGSWGACDSTLYIRKWLRLRSSAVKRGRLFDDSLTPAFLESISVQYCPIMRCRLKYPDNITYRRDKDMDPSSVWSVDRLDNNAGYIAGNLVIMSCAANAAKHTYGFDEARELAVAAEREKDGKLGGLTPGQWARVAALTALVDSRPAMGEIVMFPSLVVIPPRVNMRNIGAGLIQQRLMHRVAISASKAEHDRLIAGWAMIFPTKKLRRTAIDFANLFSGSYYAIGKSRGFQGSAWWDLEDAWTHPGVWSKWVKLMSQSPMDQIVQQLSDSMIEKSRLEAWDIQAGLNSSGYAREIDFDEGFSPQREIPSSSFSGTWAAKLSGEIASGRSRA